MISLSLTLLICQNNLGGETISPIKVQSKHKLHKVLTVLGNCGFLIVTPNYLVIGS